jgi:hypothetical protein
MLERWVAHRCAVVAGALAVLVGVGVAAAAIPAADGTIHGCFNKASGVLRLVDAGVACKTGEQAISWSQRGPQGPPGPPGPVGPAGAGTPPADPTPYTGVYLVGFGGPAFYALHSFAGCKERTLNGEYEDCVLTIQGRFPAELTAWINDTAASTSLTRDIVVVRVNQSFDVLSRLEILGGFLSQTRLPDLDGTSQELATFGFVVTPRQLRFAPPGVVQLAPSQVPLLLAANFRVEIDGVPGAGFVTVRNLALVVDKVPFTDVDGRLRFNPGTPSFTQPVLGAGGIPDTLAGLQQWATDTATGQPGAARAATIQLLRPNLTPLVSLQLSAVQPVTPLEPFPVDGQQHITVDYQQLLIQ